MAEYRLDTLEETLKKSYDEWEKQHNNIESKKIRNNYAKSLLETFNLLPNRAKELFFEQLVIFDISNEERSSIIEQFKTDYFAKAIGSFMFHRNGLLLLCDSPIEELFLFSFHLYTFYYSELKNPISYDYLCLWPQQIIEINEHEYRADFKLEINEVLLTKYSFEPDFKLLIECDGHDYHKRTKKQIIYENQREYDLKAAGYDILHFSGSQIYHDPFKCIEDTIKYFCMKVGKMPWQM